MDLTSPREIKAIAEHFGFTFKKGLGQNFLTEKRVLFDIAEAACGADGIIEIGPGFGVLTYELASRFKRVVAVEMDKSLPEVLKYTLGEFDNVEIICADILKTDIAELIREKFCGMRVNVAANLPYYVTTPIISKLLTERLPIESIVIMIQKEVAERICAREGTKAYGALSVMCRYYTEPEMITVVGAESFVPRPKVDSAVLRLRVCDKPTVDTVDEIFFFKTVHAAFSQRRKTLLNCLSSSFKMSKDELTQILRELDIDDKRRGETLSMKEFAALSDKLFYRRGKSND